MNLAFRSSTHTKVCGALCALFVVALFTLLLGGCKGEDEADPTATESSAGEKDKEEEGPSPLTPLDVVRTAEEAQWVSGDVKAFLPLWTEGCHMTHGKKEKSDVFDAEPYDYNLMESWAHIEFSKPKPEGIALAQTDVKEVDEDGKKIVTLTNVITWPENETKVGVRYTLVPVGDTWLIKSRHSWPISWRKGTEETVYDQKAWNRLNREIANLTKGGAEDVDSRKLTAALLAAYKIKQAYAEANTRILDGEEMTLEDWKQFAEISLRCGHADSAAQTYEKIKKLDPKAEVPQGALNWSKE